MKTKFLSQLTWKRVLSVTTICASLTAVIWPSVAQAVQDLFVRQAANNARKTGQALFAYAADWDGVIPRHDNNGSCIYGEYPCNTPDWGDLIPPNEDLGLLEVGKEVMLLGALRPYMQPPALWYDPAIGRTDWKSATADSAMIGWNPIRGPYSSAYDSFYDFALGQLAGNILLVDYRGVTGAVNNRPGAVRGRLSLVVRPEQTIAAVMESTWDYALSGKYGIGNGLVWPSFPDTNCWLSNSDGWTRYVLPIHGESVHRYEGDGTAYYGHPNRAKLNPHLQGQAMFVFVDGHVAPMRYSEAERCSKLPTGTVWRVSNILSLNTYYPHWVPEL